MESKIRLDDDLDDLWKILESYAEHDPSVFKALQAMQTYKLTREHVAIFLAVLQTENLANTTEKLVNAARKTSLF